jgi:hypothetical protein
MRLTKRALLLITTVVLIIVISTRLKAETGTCGGASVTLPFMDVASSNIFFCSIAAAYFSGLTNGTSPTSYSPSANVTREQMAAFVSRTLNQSITRSRRRAALGQWWKAQGGVVAGGGGDCPSGVNDVVCDGTDLWVASPIRVSRFRPSDCSLIAFYTMSANTLVSAGTLMYVGWADTLKYFFQNSFYTVASGFSGNLTCLAFDGRYVWTGSDAGVIGKVQMGELGPGSVTTVQSGFGSLSGMLFDGNYLWVVDNTEQLMFRLDANGNGTGTVVVGEGAGKPVFDGINIWVPNRDDSTITVVRAKDASGDPVTPFVLATLTGNGLNGPTAAAFDGERIAVTNFFDVTISFWNAADLTQLGNSPFSFNAAPYYPFRICSDGLSFWVGAIDNSSDGLLQRF